MGSYKFSLNFTCFTLHGYAINQGVMNVQLINNKIMSCTFFYLKVTKHDLNISFD